MKVHKKFFKEAYSLDDAQRIADELIDNDYVKRVGRDLVIKEIPKFKMTHGLTDEQIKTITPEKPNYVWFQDLLSWLDQAGLLKKSAPVIPEEPDLTTGRVYTELTKLFKKASLPTADRERAIGTMSVFLKGIEVRGKFSAQSDKLLRTCQAKIENVDK